MQHIAAHLTPPLLYFHYCFLFLFSQRNAAAAAGRISTNASTKVSKQSLQAPSSSSTSCTPSLAKKIVTKTGNSSESDFCCMPRIFYPPVPQTSCGAQMNEENIHNILIYFVPNRGLEWLLHNFSYQPNDNSLSFSSCITHIMVCR